ncbi:unnamed protein product [Protopolystoma xenopodis]|uniref:Uncharacterized protein n=1 Tax=Protopolystoma xenopodis TaxID=117903 RepID=A0A3S5CDN6_9PLAT|nr:unnamed protein product [Protopolystoma xenopodis]
MMAPRIWILPGASFKRSGSDGRRSPDSEFQNRLLQSMRIGSGDSQKSVLCSRRHRPLHFSPTSAGSLKAIADVPVCHSGPHTGRPYV